MFELFTDRGRRVVILAQQEAQVLGHSSVDPVHLLLGCVSENEGIAGIALRSLGVTLDPLRHKVLDLIPSGEVAEDRPIAISQRTTLALELSLRESLKLGHSYIGTEHLLLGLVRQGDPDVEQILLDSGTNLGRVGQEVEQAMSGRMSPTPQPNRAPWCPHCRAVVADVAKYRTVSIEPEDAGADGVPIQVQVVYCTRCGGVIGMFNPEV
jgi:ATP-dependent Clp protease ATP-binding subunit ClpA